MSSGCASSSIAASVCSSPSLDSSGTIKLWLDGDDPYTGFEEFPPLQCFVTNSEEEQREEEENVEIEEQQPEEELDESKNAEELDESKNATEGESIVVDKLRPCIGMEFGSADEAYNFYDAYAGHAGFSIRRNSQGKLRNGEVSYVRFVCNKEGLSKRQKYEQKGMDSFIERKASEKEQGTTRTNCKARLSVRLTKERIWQVTVFNEEHNHDLLKSPLKKKNMRSQKCITIEDIETIRDLSAQNVDTSKIYEYIVAKQGGKSKLHFKKNDVSNQISTQNRKVIGFDVETTLYYFRKKQEKDPEFFYSIDADEEGRVQHVFWVDGKARRAYLEFGDVVTFDTTFNTNRYAMPLAPFIGVNHHRHSIFFGMVLIRSEEWNFSWLFETWLRAMYGKHPVSIITCQDPAMKVAIKKIFPNTIHRCCQWHILRQAREKFLTLYGANSGLEDKLKTIINCSLTVLDFEEGWNNMLESYKINNSDHWKVMYDNRSEWVPAFFRSTFFAEMSMTHRIESMNAILKLWLDNHTSIYQFIQKIEMMIENIWHKESDEDIKNIQVTSSLWSPYPIECEARNVYTREIFVVFKEILWQSCLGVVIEHERDKQYEVSIKTNHLVRNWKPKSFIVEVDKATETFSCNCKGFEFEGVLCPHAIKVLLYLGLEHLPKKYIMHRWCKGANDNAKKSAHERGEDSEELLAFRRKTLRDEFNEIEQRSSANAADFMFVLSKIRQLRNEMKLSRQPQPQVEPAMTEEGQPDPPLSQCKRRKKH